MSETNICDCDERKQMEMHSRCTRGLGFETTSSSSCTARCSLSPNHVRRCLCLLVRLSFFCIFWGQKRSKGSYTHHQQAVCIFFFWLERNSTGEQRYFSFENARQARNATHRSPRTSDGVVLVHSVFEFLQGLARISMCTARSSPPSLPALLSSSPIRLPER